MVGAGGSVEVLYEADHEVGAFSKGVGVVIVSESNSDPEAFDDEVVLDSKNQYHKREEGRRICRA